MKELLNEMMEKDLEKQNLNEAQVIILRQYLNTKKYFDTNKIVIDDIIWEQNYQDFVDYLRETGIKEFIIIEASSGLIKLLSFLLSNGFEIKNGIKVERKNKEFSFEVAECGLLIEVK